MNDIYINKNIIKDKSSLKRLISQTMNGRNKYNKYDYFQIYPSVI